MADNNQLENQEAALATTEVTATVSQWLTNNGFEHEFLGLDKQGVPILKVERIPLRMVSPTTAPTATSIS